MEQLHAYARFTLVMLLFRKVNIAAMHAATPWAPPVLPFKIFLSAIWHGWWHVMAVKHPKLGPLARRSMLPEGRNRLSSPVILQLGMAAPSKDSSSVPVYMLYKTCRSCQKHST